MESTKWLLIPVEVQVRELASRMLLACGAAARGYQAVIGRRNALFNHIERLPTGLVIEKSIDSSRVNRLQRLARRGWKIAASDEETLFCYKDPEKFVETRLADGALAVTERFLCWSDRQRDLLADLVPKFADKFVATGTSRSDLWRREFAAVFNDDARQIREEVGPYILFNSNFAGVISHFGEGHTFDALAKTGYLSDDARLRQFEREQRQYRQNLDAYRAVLKKISDWFPSRMLVIRPHPGDQVGYWEAYAADSPRIRVAFEGPVTPWLMAADLVVHHGCTTGIEARILGVPQVVFAPHEDDEHDNLISARIAQDAGDFITDEGALHDRMRDILQGAARTEPQIWPLDPYFDALEGPFAFERSLDALDGIDLPTEPPSSWMTSAKVDQFSWGERVSRGVHSYRKDLTRRMSGRAKTAPPKNAPPARKWLGATAAELTEMAQGFSDCAPQLRPATVSQVGEDLFWVR